MLIIAVTFVIHEQHVAAFRAAILDNARLSLEREAQCFVFDVCESPAGGTFFLYEKYADGAAFEAHLASDHFKSFDHQVAPWVKDKVVQRYTLVSPQ